jgi:hypothetical protein
VRIVFTPLFSKREFRAPAAHYRLDLAGSRIAYAYIRKNASTAFKRLIGHRRHPRWLLRRALGRTRGGQYDLDGNLASWFVPPSDLHSARFSERLFVYRDPVDRFISVFVNKFVDGDPGEQIVHDLTHDMGGVPLEHVTLRHLMHWAKRPFSELDPHLWPQKSHLADITYSIAIPLDDLLEEMRRLMGGPAAERWFGRRVNASPEPLGPPGSPSAISPDQTVGELRARRAAGEPFDVGQFMTDEVRHFVRDRYASDVEMIAELRRLRTAVAEPDPSRDVHTASS